MADVTIGLRAPVAARTIEGWVEERVAALRDAAWSRGVRLGDLSRAWQAQDADWLIEVDLRDRAVALEDDLVLGSMLMEMSLLGLRPELQLSSEREGSTASQAAAAGTEATA